MNDRLAKWAPPAAVVAVAFLAFLPALTAGFVNYDDDYNLFGQTGYRGLSFENLKWMFSYTTGIYIPLTWVSFAVDYSIWRLNPFGYHLTNLLLHLASAFLFYRLALWFVGDRGRWAAAAGALFFAVHPLRVESVAWVTERRDVLSGFFLLLTVLAYLRMTRSDEPKARRGWYLASIALFALSLLSKASAMALPAVLLVMDVYPLRRFVPGRRGRVLLEKVPFAVLSVAIAAVAFFSQQRGGAAATLAQHGVGERVIQAAYGLSFYIWKTIVPLWLSPLYPLERVTLAKAHFLIGTVATVVITVVLIALRKRRPELLAGWICYAALVSPVLGFVQSGPHLAADRFTYHSCMPWALIAAAGVAAFWEKRPAWRTSIAGGAGTVLAVLAVLCFVQAGIWKDSFSLWNHALAVTRRNPVASMQRGLLQKDYRKAISDFDAAVEGDPRNSFAFYCRGIAKEALGDRTGAARDYSSALATAPPDWEHRPGAADALRRVRLEKRE